MTVRLTVQRAEWRAHVRAIAEAYGPGLVPVVKGNGYGFGRDVLHWEAETLGHTTVCVGSVHELDDVPADVTPVVLTPTLAPPAPGRAVLTVGAPEHVAALAEWAGDVMVKLASSMRRYGVEPRDLPALREAVDESGLAVEAFALHLPLAGTDAERVAEVEAWLPHLPADTPVWLSHLRPAAFRALADAHPDREFRIRVGTLLWQGIPRGAFLHLSAEVLALRAVTAGEPVGYFRTPAPYDGTIVAIGAGAANGVAPLDTVPDADSSPFHFDRQRMTLLERPHMHTSLAVVPTGGSCPRVGDHVDVQRPYITTHIDELVWV